MRSFLRSLLSATTVALVLAGCSGEPLTALPAEAGVEPMATAAEAGEPIPDRYIVVFRDGVPDVRPLAVRMVSAAGGELHYTYEHALHGFAATLPAQAVTGIRRNPNVAYVEQDSVVTIVTTTQPNATWGLDRVDQRALPLNGTYSYDYIGNGVRAYVIDTGILDSHDDFGGRVTSGFTAIADGRGTSDCNGHGTHVAGTIGGSVYGVAKGVTLVPVRVLDCNGSGTTSGVIAGVDWVTANHVQPAVANMSLGGGASTSLDTAVRNAIAAGVSYAVAAGNGNWLGREANACNYSPARVAEAITVGATTNTDAKTSWSNYGDCVDWFAPGAGITSAWHTSTSATNTISGTSMATPHVAGAAALYLQANSGATPQQVRDALYEATTKGIVTNSRTANNHLLFTLFDGGGSTPVNQPPNATFTYACSDLTCSFADTSTDADGTIVSRSWDFDDGARSTATTPSHTFAAAGSYTVRLTVTDDDGATGTASQPVTVSGGDASGPTLSGSAAKSGPNWIATVTLAGSAGHTTSGTWSPSNEAGSCTIPSGASSCSFSITSHNRVGQVTYADTSGLGSVTIDKP
jgi:subtilisin family serine protease